MRPGLVGRPLNLQPVSPSPPQPPPCHCAPSGWSTWVLMSCHLALITAHAGLAQWPELGRSGQLPQPHAAPDPGAHVPPVSTDQGLFGLHMPFCSARLQ